MRYQSLAAVAALVWAITPALVAQGASPGAQASLCRTGFTLDVTVQAVGGINTWPVGFKLQYQPNEGRGLASRVQTDDAREFNSKQCGIWEHNNAKLLNEVLSENEKPARRSLACANVATISYKAGAKTENTRVCLGSAKTDKVTAAFQRFFANTDGLVR